MHFIAKLIDAILKQYACRKALADRRVRIHGRFAKNPEDDQPLTNRATSGEENLAVPCSNTDKVIVEVHNKTGPKPLTMNLNISQVGFA